MNETKCRTLGLAPSFGFGDRIGLATGGHVMAMQRAGAGIAPIFPQQSIREMSRTGRTPQEVMRDALAGMTRAGWSGETGADADHLKTKKDIDATAAAGFTFFTLDPSGVVDAQADDYSESELRARFEPLRSEISWLPKYLGQTLSLPSGRKVELSESACLRAAVKYGRAINLACELAGHIDAVQAAAGRQYEIELSVDETPQPTTLAEHYIIADQCLERGMKLVSLAPRFLGDFEKGVDYKGDLAALEKSLRDHAAIAEVLGPYKLSLHSGSDKLSMYPALARATEGRFHVKTAGTSYLEALRVAAQCDERFFRRIIDFARRRYPTDRATYHVSAVVEDLPAGDSPLSPEKLESVCLERWVDAPAGRGFIAPARQVLHCTFGSVLTDPALGAELKSLLAHHQSRYDEVLAEHFTRHLLALRAGM